MKTAFVMLALVLTSCAMTNAQHAEIWRAANDATAVIGDKINEEMAEDFQAAGGHAAPPEVVSELRRRWNPVLARYVRVEHTLDAYETAIRLHGSRQLLLELARSVLNVWGDLAAIADELGVPAPAAPAALVDASQRGVP